MFGRSGGDIGDDRARNAEFRVLETGAHAVHDRFGVWTWYTQLEHVAFAGEGQLAPVD
jgi:hypothetical protein